MLISFPAFKNIPTGASLAKVDSTLFTMLNLTRPSYPASLKGFNKSVVSPDWDTQSKPPSFLGKSSEVISLAIFTSTLLKQHSSLIRYYPYKEA